MERLTIREVIEHCNRHTERVEKHSSRMQLEETPIGNSDFMKQYWEHRQVSEWLQELQSLKDKQEQGLLLFNPEELKTAIIDRMQEFRDEYKQYSESTIDHFGGKADSMEVAMRIVKGAFEEALAKMGGK